jgi:hypothetical protein
MASTRLARYGTRAALAAGGLLMHAGASAGCAEMHGGELVLRSSEACLAQMRRDPALRQQLARTIGGQVAVPATPAAAGRPATPERAGRGNAGLGHPLARLSMLNAQSRYLWSLGNPAPTYYGQNAP